jgi:hypothetical protein
MIRHVLCVAAFLVPSLTAMAQSESASTQTGSAGAQSPSLPTSSTQTFDPTSAFDGYWIPPQRAREGEEDR